MEFTKLYEIVLLILLIGCAVCVNLTKSLLQAVILFMSYSSIMCLLWILMESPDLAITEAAVGAGVSGMLFLVTLKKLRQMGRVGPTDAPTTGAEAVPAEAAPESSGTGSGTDFNGNGGMDSGTGSTESGGGV